MGVINYIQQKREVGLRKVKYLVQGHRAKKWQCWNLKPSLETAKRMLLITTKNPTLFILLAPLPSLHSDSQRKERGLLLESGIASIQGWRLPGTCDLQSMEFNLEGPF